MTKDEFIADVKKVKQHRKHKITGSLGVYDAYKYARKNKWFDILRPVKEKEYYAIVRGINKYLAQELGNGKEIKLPLALGSLEIRKRPTSLSIVNGKLVTNYPIDWQATLDLWFTDEEAFRDKTLVRKEEDEVFKVYYNRSKADYTNKTFMEFTPNREIKQLLKVHAQNGTLDAFLIRSYGKGN